jgi:glutamyl-tRNA reductase
MTLVSVCLSHQFTPLHLLERLVVPAAQRQELLTRLKDPSDVREVLVLSTCNRLELYASVDGAVADFTFAALGQLARRAGLPTDVVRAHARVLTGGAVVEHLFSVTCGLDSMAVGESQIVAQVKDAARAAVEAATTGAVLTDLVDAALRVSKRARTETTIGTAGISLVRSGLELARAHRGRAPVRHAVVLGSGSVGRLAARLMSAEAPEKLSVVSRNEVSAARLAAAVAGRPLPVTELLTALADADVLISATGAPTPVVRAEHLRAARASGSPSLFVLDLGMPRDVDPAVRGLSGVTLVDIPDLGRHLAGSSAAFDVDRVRCIVAAETAAHLDLRQATVAAPAIRAMHRHADQVVDAELDRLQDRLNRLTPHQRAETEATVRRIVRAFLHKPTVRARQLSTAPDGLRHLHALLELFDVDPSEDTA